MFRLDPAPSAPNNDHQIIVMLAKPPASTGTIFFSPQDGPSNNIVFYLPTTTFSDAALTIPIAIARATITHATAFSSANANTYNCTPDTVNCTLPSWIQGTDETRLGACGVNYNHPWGSGRYSTTPPTQGSPIADGNCSVSFDPTLDPIPMSAIPPLAYNKVAATINGIGGYWTIVLHISTDQGDGIMVCGTDGCI